MLKKYIFVTTSNEIMTQSSFKIDLPLTQDEDNYQERTSNTHSTFYKELL